MQGLYFKLLRDLRSVGITVDFDLELKKYSKTYYGRYDPNKNKITLYVYQDKECTYKYSYEDLLMTLIHEAIHCMQWKDETFVRIKGIMHDTEFYKLYEEYSDRARAILLFKEVKTSDNIFKKIGFSNSPVYC